MEEVWKEIHESENNSRLSRGYFEDMLIRPSMFSEGENELKNNVDDEDDKNEIFKKEILMSSVISTPGFMSSLNSPFEALATNTVVASTTNSPVSLLNTTCFPPIISTNNNNNNNKRPFSETHHYDVIEGDTGVDRRHKRMIKNRESAARSRARRQAYTSQLEREQQELKEENAMLRKQQQESIELLLSTTRIQVPKNCIHNRSRTY